MKIVTLWLEDDDYNRLEKAWRIGNYKNRSEFIRKAIEEKLKD